jgi:hypothetical protein
VGRYIKVKCTGKRWGGINEVGFDGIKTRMVVMPSMFPLINTHSSCNLKNNIN